ncbi:hypothetical protein [Ralstonia mannitolilytica]|uniref:hypothetical protein n=1 Tax=Ralstonia mannitolilytica TaxID=105219 RepID=UPI003748273A
MTTSAQRFVAKLAFQAMLALACVLGSQSAMAMRCVASGGADKFVEPIGSVQTYPVNAPDGYIIWISPTRTTTGYCYKDLRAGVSWEDPVFFYANPANMDPAAWGLEIGIRYKGVDHFGASNQVGTGVPTGDIVPVCTTADFDAGLCPKVPVSITYQVVVRKRGTWTGVPQDTYPVFQFDGARGLNCCNTSFQYILSGLENLKPTPCIVDVTVTPEPGIVDFGHRFQRYMVSDEIPRGERKGIGVGQRGPAARHHGRLPERIHRQRLAGILRGEMHPARVDDPLPCRLRMGERGRRERQEHCRACGLHVVSVFFNVGTATAGMRRDAARGTSPAHATLDATVGGRGIPPSFRCATTLAHPHFN